MDITTTLATKGYSQARSPTAPQPGTAEAGFASFVSGFAATLSEGEATAQAAMVGGADPHALVRALADSQLAVETVATVRDKVVEAYQEILRMPV